MGQISRKEARDMLFGLLFETEFKKDDEKLGIYELSCENRDIPDNIYIKSCFFGICENTELLDFIIGKYAKGWKADRLSKVSRTVIRLAVYEMLFVKDIHSNISVSEAVELSKKYGEEKARAFVNGVLSSIDKEIATVGVESFVASAKRELEVLNKEGEQKEKPNENESEAQFSEKKISRKKGGATEN